MLMCFECDEIIKDEIGIHLTLVHLWDSVQDWNKPVRAKNGRILCGICEIAPTDMKRYLIHSTFAHGALYELNKSLNLNLDGGIAQALFERTENEERRRKREAKPDNRGVKRQ